MELDELKYGNITQQQEQLLERRSYLETYFAEFTTLSYAPNTSEYTKSELNDIVEALGAISMDQQNLRRFQQFDANMHNVFVNYLAQKGADGQDAYHLVNAIVTDLLPLITKLKYYFGRPRPAQLAYYYQLKLFPYASSTADSPSYPSSHAIQARLISTIIGNKYPEVYKEIRSIAEDITMSRLYLGLNYPSDLDFGTMIADMLIENKELCLKYKI